MAAYDEAVKRDADGISAKIAKAGAFDHVGYSLAALSRNDEAVASYQAAIALVDAVLADAPDNVDACKQKAIALTCLADVQSKMSNFDAALSNCQSAICYYDKMI